MKYKGVLLTVKDIDAAVDFFKRVFNLRVIADFGANKTLTGGIFLQTLESWKQLICSDEISFNNKDGELYFEEEDFDGFIERIKKMENVEYVHSPLEHSWGQRVVRIYDLDGHIIEIGESLTSVAKKFSDLGMSISQIADRMGVSVSYVSRLLRVQKNS